MERQSGMRTTTWRTRPVPRLPRRVLTGLVALVAVATAVAVTAGTEHARIRPASVESLTGNCPLAGCGENHNQVLL